MLMLLRVHVNHISQHDVIFKMVIGSCAILFIVWNINITGWTISLQDI